GGDCLVDAAHSSLPGDGQRHERIRKEDRVAERQYRQLCGNRRGALVAGLGPGPGRPALGGRDLGGLVCVIAHGDHSRNEWRRNEKGQVPCRTYGDVRNLTLVRLRQAVYGNTAGKGACATGSPPGGACSRKRAQSSWTCP